MVDPLGFGKVKFLLEDSVGFVSPGMDCLYTGTPTVEGLNAVAADLADIWEPELTPLLTADWTFAQLKVLISDGTVVIEGVNVLTGAVGTLSGATETSRQDCIVTGYQIGSYYRGGKPRTYWPGPWRVESVHPFTHWKSPDVDQYAINVQAGIDATDSHDFSGDTLTLGCIRRVSGGTALTPPQFFPYLGTHVDHRICTQRRRLGRL
jgi:hypothetical protein